MSRKDSLSQRAYLTPIVRVDATPPIKEKDEVEVEAVSLKHSVLLELILSLKSAFVICGLPVYNIR